MTARLTIPEIVDSIKADDVADELHKALNSVIDRTCEKLRDHLLDEFQLDFEYITDQRAIEIVKKLLRGEGLERFALRLQQSWKGEPFSYDPAGIRKAIVRDFGNEIATAEMHEMQEEIKRLNDRVNYLEMRREY